MWKYLGPSSLDVVVPRAQRAIDDLEDENKKEWHQKLLNILKEEKCARIKFKRHYPKENGIENSTLFIDVTRVSHTWSFASFFDVYNKDYYVDYSFEPIAIDKPKFKLV